MKTIQQIEKVEILTEDKKVEILALINKNWDEFESAHDMAKFIMDGYIFGTFAENQHINIDDIIDLIKVVDLEKNPPPVVEVVEPLIEEIK